MTDTSGKTVTRSFRISETALKALEEDAQKQTVSLNTMVNQLLISYTSFDRLFKRFRPVKVSTTTFKRILEAASNDAVSEAGSEAGRSVPHAFILAQKGTLTLEGALEYVRLLSDYANMFEYSDVYTGGKKVITLSHELGHKGSIFLSHCIQALLEQINMHPKIDIDETVVSFAV